MIDISVLQEEVGDVLETLSGVPCIVEEQEGHKPADNFIAYKFKNWMQQGRSASEYVSPESISTRVQTLWRVTLELIGVGNYIEQTLITLSHKLSRPATRQSFYDVGITYLNKDVIKSFPKVITTGWEQRYSLDINFTLVLEDFEDLNYFEFLQITNTIKDFNDSVLLEESFTVDIVP